MRISVETYTGPDGVEMLRRFHLDGREIGILEKLDQWHGPDYRYVKVRGDDGNFYILRFNEDRAEWELTMFERARSDAAAARLDATRLPSRTV